MKQVLATHGRPETGLPQRSVLIYPFGYESRTPCNSASPPSPATESVPKLHPKPFVFWKKWPAALATISNSTKKKSEALPWQSSAIPCRTPPFRPASPHRPCCSEPSAVQPSITILANFAPKLDCCAFARSSELSPISVPLSFIRRWLPARLCAKKSSKEPTFSSCANCSADYILASHAPSKALPARARRSTPCATVSRRSSASLAPHFNLLEPAAGACSPSTSRMFWSVRVSG